MITKNVGISMRLSGIGATAKRKRTNATKMKKGKRRWYITMIKSMDSMKRRKSRMRRDKRRDYR